MKLIHTSDLHLGKRFRERSLLEDQKYVLDQILDLAADEDIDGVIIAGDVYDKSVPPAEAVLLFDEFLVRLSGLCRHIFIISGNHDSPERLSFGGRLMEESGVHVAHCFDGKVQRVRLKEADLNVNIWMLPFIKPIHVRAFNEDVDRDDYTGALRTVLEGAAVEAREPGNINILIAHQYVTGSERTESEEVPVGGLDGVDPEIFRGFDYVALGHLHRAQIAGGEKIRYSGSPIKYSFSEEKDRKQVLIMDIDSRGVEVETRPLLPLHEVRTLRGTFDQLMTAAHKEPKTAKEAYIRAQLTDEEYIPDGIQRLRSAYPNILEVRYEKVEGAAEGLPVEASSEERTPFEYLEDFFRTVRGRDMSKEQETIAREAISRIWEDEG